MSTEFYWIAVAVVTIVSSARFTRLLTFDAFPPIKAARDAFQEWTDTPKRLGWQAISYCPYCLSPYITAAVALWGYFTDFQTAWWLVNGIAAASYLAAMIQVNDGEEV